MKTKLSLMTVCSVLFTLVAPEQKAPAATSDTNPINPGDVTTGLTAYYPLNGSIREAGNGPKATVQGRGLRLAPDRAGKPTSAVGCWCPSRRRSNPSRR